MRQLLVRLSKMHPELDKIVFLPKDSLKHMKKSDIIENIFRLCYLDRLKEEILYIEQENCEKCLIDEINGIDEVDKMDTIDKQPCKHIRQGIFELFDRYGLQCMDKIYKTPEMKKQIYEKIKKECADIKQYCTINIEENDIFHYYYEQNAVGTVSNLIDPMFRKAMVVVWK